jgi:adenylate cyclase
MHVPTQHNPRGWPLQAVVALVFTALTVSIAGGLVLYNHGQLTRFAKREAHANFTAVTHLVRQDREANRRISELLLDTASATIDPDMPRDRINPMLLELMRHVERALPATFGIFIAWPDGTMAGAQDLTGQRPAELVGLDEGRAVLGLNTIERTAEGAREAWVLYDRAGAAIARTDPKTTGYDPRNRVWYKQAMAATGTILTSPYPFSTAPGAGVTLARALPGHPGVVLGLDITLVDLDRILQENRKDSPAEPVIFDRQGRLVAHPDGETLRRRARIEPPHILPNLSDVGSPLLSALNESFKANGLDKDVHLTAGGQTYIARFEPAGSAMGDFILGLAVPEERLMGDAYRIRLMLLAGGGTALVLALALIFFAAKRIVAPLQLASEGLGHIVALRFGQSRPIRSRVREVSELGHAVATLEPLLQNFARYVPFALVRGMIDSTFSTELGGRRQPICVVFSDIEGFTGLTEQLDPDTLTRQTSRYFAEIGQEIVRSGGTIDKYIGDAVMAFWNAPEPQDDYVRMACLGVLRASRRIDELNICFRREGAAEMPTRFGIHVGEAVVGNVGTADRMNYTALGHAVNLASRLEGLNRDFDTTILASEAVVEAAGPDFVFRPVGETVPRGASHAVRLYELLGAMIEGEPALAPPIHPPEREPGRRLEQRALADRVPQGGARNH